MPQGQYLPEGARLQSAQNQAYTASAAGLERAWRDGAIVEGIAQLCDAQHNLVVAWGDCRGIIARAEAAVGITEGDVKEIAILSRVGKPVCAKVIGHKDGHFILSRKAAQREALDYLMAHLQPGQIIPAKVTHLEPFGAFVDIGCGNVSLIGIEHISVSRIAHPRERFAPRQDIFAVVTGVEPQSGRITLSHKELLGTWAQNAARFSVGATVRGIVRGIEPYGIFVELTPNLSGLAERREGMRCGQPVAVYIKSMLPERMKIKLVIIDTLESAPPTLLTQNDYFLRTGKLDTVCYSPTCCTERRIETVF